MNSPNEKFLLMILGSQAKLENDNRGISVKRGLRRILNDNSSYDMRYWRAWSCLYMRSTPMFIKNSVRVKYAEKVAYALGLNSIDEYKTLILERGSEIEKLFSRGFWDYPIETIDIENIGTR